MASYTATLVAGPHRAEDTLRCSASIVAMEVDNPTLYEPIASVVPLTQPTYTRNSPVEELEQSHTATPVPSFLNDYYYRVHINPAVVALGAMVAVVEEEVLVWNAWFGPKTCSAINKTNPEEFTLTGESIPFSLSALEATTFILGVPLEGSLEFASTATFVFSSELVVLTITGTRVTVFPFEPLVLMKETLQWNTGILKSKDGSEQRRTLRKAPRQMFDFKTYLGTEQLQARFDALLFNGQKRMWGLPVWGELTQHSATISIDDTTIFLDTAYADYRADSFVIIWQSPTLYEAVKIDTVAADRLNLALPVRNNWIGTKWIMPLRTADMRGHVSRPATPDGFGWAKVAFLVTDNVLLTGYTAPTIYQGLPVLTDPSLVDEAQEVDSDPDADFVDYGFGTFQMYSDSEFNLVVQSYIVRKESKAARWDFRRFLHSLYGRRGAFWVVSDRNDLQPQTLIGAAETSFAIDNIKLADNMGLNDMRTHIAFILPDGTPYYREILGITESDESTEIITIDSALGVQVELGGCEICFLDKVRLTEDSIDFDWEELCALQSKFHLTRVKA